MKKTTTLAGVVLVAMTAFGVGCTVPLQAPGDGSGLGGGTAAGQQGAGGAQQGAGGAQGGQGAGVDANTRYAAETDATKANAIVTRMWAVMTGSPCFYMTNSTYNYSFFGNAEYRYSGYETTSGQIGLVSAGKFGPYDMAEAQIGGTRYWIGVADAKTLVISFVHDNGKLVTNHFIAVEQGRPCV